MGYGAGASLAAEGLCHFRSAPMLAHGLITEIGDVDIVAIRSAWQFAQKLGTPEFAPGGDRIIQVSSGLAIFDGWLSLDVEAIIERSSLQDGLPIAQLKDVAAYKRLLGRLNRVHLRLLEPYLAP